jgi:hypothetical protein
LKNDDYSSLCFHECNLYRYTAVALPGGFYPDERFLRAMVLRDAARDDPPSLESAVADAFGVLSSVAVPLVGSSLPGVSDWFHTRNILAVINLCVLTAHNNVKSAQP